MDTRERERERGANERRRDTAETVDRPNPLRRRRGCVRPAEHAPLPALPRRHGSFCTGTLPSLLCSVSVAVSLSLSLRLSHTVSVFSAFSGLPLPLVLSRCLCRSTFDLFLSPPLSAVFSGFSVLLPCCINLSVNHSISLSTSFSLRFSPTHHRSASQTPSPRSASGSAQSAASPTSCDLRRSPPTTPAHRFRTQTPERWEWVIEQWETHTERERERERETER